MKLLLAGIAVAALSVIPAPQESKQDEAIILKRPADPPIDDATWTRLRKDFQGEKGLFVDLLLQLDKNRIDHVLDSPATALAKRKLIRAALEANSQAILQKMASSAGLALNVVQLRNETGPRLSGRNLKVGEGAEIKRLDDAFIPQIKKGDSVHLAQGKHGLGFTLGGHMEFEDVAFIGEGPDRTTLTLDGRSMSKAKPWRRVRLENLRIDCMNNSFIDLRGGSMQIKNCHVFNYNSGAGGSNAIFATDSVLLVEDCTFEGMSGRSGGRHGGNAFDLRGDSVLFARNCRFIDNREIVRATFPCGFDGCISESSTANSYGITPYGKELVLLRGNKGLEATLAADFTRATDDSEFIDFACGDRKEADEGTRKLAEALHIHRNLPFWIGLLRHDQAKVRAKAAAKIEALTGRKILIGAAASSLGREAADQAIKDLDADSLEKREAAASTLKNAGESARARLLEVAEKGAGESRVVARRLLDLLDHEAKWGPEREHAAQMAWLEENRARLKWDETRNRYELIQ